MFRFLTPDAPPSPTTALFSSRTNWDFRSSEVFALLQEKRGRGEGIIDLTEANPTRCGFQYDERSILQALATQGSLTYAPNPKGLLSARVAVVEFYRQQGITIDPESVFLTASTSEAYTFLFRLLCNVGDSVLLPKPSYPLFDYLCELNDVTPAHYHLMYDGEWRLDTESLAQALSRQTRALVVVHPNNPTGSFLKIPERESITTFAGNRNLPLIVDEVFNSFAFGADTRRAASFVRNTQTLTFTLNGLSKLLGLPQLKLAWLVVSGPVAERDGAIKRLEIIADTYLSVGTPVQLALPSLLRDTSAITDQIRSRVRDNYLQVAGMVAGTSLSVYLCEGGWTALLRLPGTMPDEKWALELLRDQNVLVHPGRLFDVEQQSCIVFSLLPEPQVVRQGLQRIAQVARM
jgi:alanine-synthesizing transaminase